MKKELTQQQFQELYNQFLAMMNEKQPKKRRPRKRPNGSGTINFLGKERKKPWQPIITLGYDDETGKQIRKALPTCETREQAQEQLDLYNLMHKGYVSKKDAIKLQQKTAPTFSEIYHRLMQEKEYSSSEATLKRHKASFNVLKELHDMPIDTIDLNILQPLFDNLSTYSKKSLTQFKTIVSQCFRYAMKYDYVQKNYSEFISLNKYKEVEAMHKAVSKNDIKKIYKISKKDDFAKIILIYIYTGLRANELLELKIENVHLEENYLVGGKKTKAGTNRVVPIHPCIHPFFSNKNVIYLINRHYSNLFTALKKFNQTYNTDFKFHDFRHTFATLCTEYDLNDYYAKCIIGHAHNDITKDVYTHANIERLKLEMNKIPSPTDM